MRRRYLVNYLFFQVALSRTVVCSKVGLVPWQTILWFSYTCLCVILWSHYFPYPSWFLFRKKKELEEGCKGDAGFWDRVSCNFSGALWKYFSQVWIICQRNVIAYAHNLHLCNSLMLLEVKKKKKGNGVCPACEKSLRLFQVLTIEHDWPPKLEVRAR